MDDRKVMMMMMMMMMMIIMAAAFTVDELCRLDFTNSTVRQLEAVVNDTTVEYSEPMVWRFDMPNIMYKWIVWYIVPLNENYNLQQKKIIILPCLKKLLVYFPRNENHKTIFLEKHLSRKTSLLSRIFSAQMRIIIYSKKSSKKNFSMIYFLHSQHTVLATCMHRMLQGGLLLLAAPIDCRATRNRIYPTWYSSDSLHPYVASQLWKSVVPSERGRKISRNKLAS